MYIAKKAKVTGNSRKPDYEKLKLLLGQICLRRSASVILTSLNCTFVVTRPRLSEKERIDYKMLVNSCCRAIDACLASRPTRGGNNAVLTALLRLRIFCNTGMSDIGDDFMPDENISLLQQGGDAMCTECNANVLFSGAADSIESQKRHQFRVKKCHKCAQWDSSSANAENVSEDPQDLKNIDIDELIPHTRTDLGQYSILNHISCNRLNGLSIASRVHILEPQWNPSVEKQAIGRIFRLGQTRPIHVRRYIVADTIEEVSWVIVYLAKP